jgi:vitamin B12 transporter
MIPRNKITAGFEYEEERGASHSRWGTWVSRFERQTVNNRAYYVQSQIELAEVFKPTLGIRIDDHQRFGTEPTYKVSTLYQIEPLATRLKANWGTGFKAPSLFQLYSIYGDPNLKPEKSRSYDLGFEHSLFNDNVLLGVTYFYNKFKNMIEWDQVLSQYNNTGRAKTDGIEAELKWKYTDAVTFNISYTHLSTKNEDTKKKLRRRPGNQINLGVDWELFKKAHLHVTALYVGHRWEDSANTLKTKPYTRVDLFTTYNFTDELQIFGKINNLFNRKYQEIDGFATEGTAFYGGIKKTF